MMKNNDEKVVLLDKIITKQGDKGKSLKGCCGFADKSDLWFEVIGAFDELNALVGVAFFQTYQYKKIGYTKTAEMVKNTIYIVQNSLFDIGADMCLDINSNLEELKAKWRINDKYIMHLEEVCGEMQKTQPPLTSFIIPTGEASYWHVARSSARKAERLFWEYNQEKQKHNKENNINQKIGVYLNRLSDLFFIISRDVSNNMSNHKDMNVLWKPGILKHE